MALADLKLPPISYHKAAHYTQGRTEPVRAFVNHRMVGTLAGTTAYFANPATRPVSTHFGIGKIYGKVEIHQYVPLDDTAYGNGNYDVSGRWDDWGYRTTEVNAQTISIEHQDHWGDPARKGIVPDDVQQASMKLQALIKFGTPAQWKAAGLVFRDWANAKIIAAEVAKWPVNGRRIITHNDIAGELKPYCWLPWAEDKVGYPRAKYVNGIEGYGKILQMTSPVTPPVTATYTQAQLDEAVKAAVAPYTLKVAELTEMLNHAAAAAASAQNAASTAQEALEAFKLEAGKI